LLYKGRFGGVATLQARLAAVPKHLSPHVVVFGGGAVDDGSMMSDVSVDDVSVDDVSTAMALLLASRGVPRVAVLRGGFGPLARAAAAHDHARSHAGGPAAEKADSADGVALALPSGRCRLLGEAELPDAEPSSPLLAHARDARTLVEPAAGAAAAGAAAGGTGLPPLSAADADAEAGRIWRVGAWRADDVIAARRLQAAVETLTGSSGNAAGARRALAAQVVAPLCEASRRAEASLRGSSSSSSINNSSSSSSSSINNSSSSSSNNGSRGGVARAESVAACVVRLHATLDALGANLASRLPPTAAPTVAASTSPGAALQVQLPPGAAAATSATRRGGSFLDLLARGELGSRSPRDILA
jgi:hypothetical protein